MSDSFSFFCRISNPEPTRYGVHHRSRCLAGCLLYMVLCGCSHGSGLPAGEAAYASIPAPTAGSTVDDYKIGALDTLSVTVFQEPDLSQASVQVDASGNILLPLIGQMK